MGWKFWKKWRELRKTAKDFKLAERQLQQIEAEMQQAWLKKYRTRQDDYYS
jgi:hypothetical protein